MFLRERQPVIALVCKYVRERKDTVFMLCESEQGPTATSATVEMVTVRVGKRSDGQRKKR